MLNVLFFTCGIYSLISGKIDFGKHFSYCILVHHVTKQLWSASSCYVKLLYNVA